MKRSTGAKYRRFARDDEFREILRKDDGMRLCTFACTFKRLSVTLERSMFNEST